MIVRVAATQFAPILGDLEGNTDAIAGAITDAVAAGADLLVLPELATSGYVFEDAAEAAAVAIHRDDSRFELWSRILTARPQAIVVLGFAERGDDGAIYNSAALVGVDGVIDVYRKVHLWDGEKHIFSAGDSRPLVVDTAIGRVGVMICFDLEFPEWTRIAALDGAEILAVPTNWPYVERPAGERAPEVLIGMAAARVNRMAVVCADRTGIERGVSWNEGSCVIDADGWPQDTVGEGPGTAWADIDPALSRNKQLTDLVDAFDDRRPDLYASLLDDVSSPTRIG